MMTDALPPGSTIGIFGSGQLGRMLALAAARLGLNTHIYAPTGADSPAAQVATDFTTGDYWDEDAVLRFAQSCDALTYEFENIPSATAELAQSAKPLFPAPNCLDVSQDRLSEKRFISETAVVPVAPFEDVKNAFDVKRFMRHIDGGCVLKTRRFGYDGKGQVIIRTPDEIEEQWAKIGSEPVIAEAFIPFEREVSIICARTQKGEIAAYPLTENVHRNHILHTSVAPAPRANGNAQDLAIRIMEELNYVGVMATEFFELSDGSLMVNEIAPRVHNSGHWTQDAGCTDQFEQHIRAVAGWPLGEATPKSAVTMTNLIGDDVTAWETFAGEPGTCLHLYGKKDIRAGRKMGHINRPHP